MSYVPMIDSRQLTLYQMTMTLQFTYTSKIGILKSLDTIILCAPAMVSTNVAVYRRWFNRTPDWCCFTANGMSGVHFLMTTQCSASILVRDNYNHNNQSKTLTVNRLGVHYCKMYLSDLSYVRDYIQCCTWCLNNRNK